jgi:hypothetical protein
MSATGVNESLEQVAGSGQAETDHGGASSCSRGFLDLTAKNKPLVQAKSASSILLLARERLVRLELRQHPVGQQPGLPSPEQVVPLPVLRQVLDVVGMEAKRLDELRARIASRQGREQSPLLLSDGLLHQLRRADRLRDLLT